jgi:hypothetical protein
VPKILVQFALFLLKKRLQICSNERFGLFVWTMSYGWLVVWQSHLSTHILVNIRLESVGSMIGKP